MANIYYKNAIDTEKRETVTQIFSELTIVDRKLSNIKIKEGFAALFARHSVTFGSGSWTKFEIVWLIIVKI